MTRLCLDCGAQNHIRDIWEGEDRSGCQHKNVEVLCSPSLEAEVKLLLAKYTPAELRVAVERMAGGGL